MHHHQSSHARLFVVFRSRALSRIGYAATIACLPKWVDTSIQVRPSRRMYDNNMHHPAAATSQWYSTTRYRACHYSAPPSAERSTTSLPKVRSMVGHLLGMTRRYGTMSVYWRMGRRWVSPGHTWVMIPDGKGNRYCINLVSVAGNPAWKSQFRVGYVWWSRVETIYISSYL